MPKRRHAERDGAIGARICLARILGDLTRPALCRKLGVTLQQLARYERGKAAVPASLLEDLCGVFKTGPAFFLSTDLSAVAQAQLLGLPKGSSIAGRHLDQALAVLQRDGGSGGGGPFASAAPAAQRGSAVA